VEGFINTLDYEIFNVFDFVLYFVDNEVQMRQKHDQTDQKEQNEPEIWYPEGFAPVPASEPDLTLVPKKSAMKGMGGGDSKPSTPNSVARDKNDNHSHVNFSHVDEITTPNN
jgi:hypothetical protein